MANFNFNNSTAISGISGVIAAAESQAENKASFDSAIQTLAGYFSGNVATKFMAQASKHAENLANDTETMTEIAHELDNVRKYMLQKIEEQSK